MCSGETLRRLRLLKNYSQKGIAIKLGISQPAYSKMEKRKKVNDGQVEKVLRIMHCDQKDLDTIQKFCSPEFRRQ